MNTLYRAMLPAEDGAPMVGDSRNQLGVRPSDVKGANAGPGQGGLSVTVGDYRRMMAPLRPKAFGGLHPETVLPCTSCRAPPSTPRRSCSWARSIRGRTMP